MIDTLEFLDRCDDARTSLIARNVKTEQLERELRALCALTGYRVETGAATHQIERWLTVFNAAGEPVCSGPAEEILEGLVEDLEVPDAPFALFETPRDVVTPAGFLRGLAELFDQGATTG